MLTKRLMDTTAQISRHKNGSDSVTFTDTDLNVGGSSWESFTSFEHFQGSLLTNSSEILGRQATSAAPVNVSSLILFPRWPLFIPIALIVDEKRVAAEENRVRLFHRRRAERFSQNVGDETEQKLDDVFSSFRFIMTDNYFNFYLRWRIKQTLKALCWGLQSRAGSRHGCMRGHAAFGSLKRRKKGTSSGRSSEEQMFKLANQSLLCSHDWSLINNRKINSKPENILKNVKIPCNVSVGSFAYWSLIGRWRSGGRGLVSLTADRQEKIAACTAPCAAELQWDVHLFLAGLIWGGAMHLFEGALPPHAPAYSRPCYRGKKCLAGVGMKSFISVTGADGFWEGSRKHSLT